MPDEPLDPRWTPPPGRLGRLSRETRELLRRQPVPDGFRATLRTLDPRPLDPRPLDPRPLDPRSFQGEPAPPPDALEIPELPEEEGEPEPELLLQQEEASCQGSFLSARRLPRNWYSQNGLTPLPAKGSDLATVEVSETVSIFIYWTVLAGAWTQAGTDRAKAKIDEAHTWFEDNYCIDLSFSSIALSKADRKSLAMLVAKGKFKEVYKNLWKKQLGRPTGKFLLVLFVDRLKPVKYDKAKSVVAGNFAKIPVILIPRDPDAASGHILTHQLVRGLGKVWKKGDQGTRTTPYVSIFSGKTDRRYTWDPKVGAATDMGRLERQLKKWEAASKPASHRLDWASYYTYLKLSETIFEDLVEGD